MQKKIVLLYVALILSQFAISSPLPLSQYGVEVRDSSYFKDRYIYNNLVYYLDQNCVHVTYQTETTGEYNTPDQNVFSVEGNSFKWNRYYLDGFRIDSRFFVGSTLYTPDMYRHNFALDYIGSKLYYSTTDSHTPSVSFSYNIGNLGGISAGSESVIHIFHPTATERQYLPFTSRNHVSGSGSASANFSLKRNGKEYEQSFSATFGERNIVFFDQKGITGGYPMGYGSVQMAGETPLTIGGLFDKTNYLLFYTQRDDLYSEFYYNLNELAEYTGYSGSFYGVKEGDKLSYTTGFTFATNTTSHYDLNFSRNLIDQDGEAFDCYYPDGTTYELSHSFTYSRKLNSWLSVNADLYNTFLYFSPTQTSFYNTTYYQNIKEATPTALQYYDWHSNSFASGLLENSVGLYAEKELSRSVVMRANLDLTLDAMLLGGGKSEVNPNFEAQLGFSFNPTKWFSAEINLAKKRISYNIDDIRFLSDDYLSGEVYSIDDKNGNGYYDEGEKGAYFTSSGGEYHSMADGLGQQGYFVVDVPINFTFGRHRISILQNYRKYFNQYRVRYENDASEYGYYKQIYTNFDNAKYGIDGQTMDVFFLNGGESINYVVDYYPEDLMGDGFFTSTPYYFCSNVEYSYTAPKFMISVGWQSYMMCGLSALGNGPLSNNIGVLSESSANPNVLQVENDITSSTRGVGRLDQDKAYILRLFASYNITKKFTMAANFKFKDGQPFSVYHSDSSITLSDGYAQLAIWPENTRGINPTDDSFGCREDAVFNIDIRATYRTVIAKRMFEFGLYCYNVYDFGNELTEYVFEGGLNPGRRSMSITIPRGLIMSLKIDL